MVKNCIGSPFTVFGIVRFFKMNIFCLEIRFSQAQHATFETFFQRPAFFLCDFFLICFHRNENLSPQFLLKTKRFASPKGSLPFSALCDLRRPSSKSFPEKISKFFLSNFRFLESIRLRKMFFLL